MTRLRRLILAVVSAAALGGALVGVVAAGDLSQTYDVGVAECEHTISDQLCDQVETVQVTTEGVLRVQFTAASTHCAPVVVRLFLDGVERFVSAPIGPGERAPMQDFGPVVAGAHNVGVQAEGVPGGCNAGIAASWAGQLAVVVSDAPPGTPAPAAGTPGSTSTDFTPFILGFAGLLAIGGGVLWYATRKRLPSLDPLYAADGTAIPPNPIMRSDPHRDALIPTGPHLGTDAFIPTEPHRAATPPNPIAPPDQDADSRG